MSCQRIAEIAGLLGTLSGTIAALLLAYPLFHLLRTREAIEDLEAVHPAKRDDENEKLFRESARDLRNIVRRRRSRAIRVGIAGAVFLVFALALVLVQVWCVA